MEERGAGLVAWAGKFGGGGLGAGVWEENKGRAACVVVMVAADEGTNGAGEKPGGGASRHARCELAVAKILRQRAFAATDSGDPVCRDAVGSSAALEPEPEKKRGARGFGFGVAGGSVAGGLRRRPCRRQCPGGGRGLSGGGQRGGGEPVACTNGGGGGRRISSEGEVKTARTVGGRRGRRRPRPVEAAGGSTGWLGGGRAAPRSPTFFLCFLEKIVYWYLELIRSFFAVLLFQT